MPKLVCYKGTVWASWDPEAPEFLDYLGGAVDHLDQVLDCRDGRPGGSEVIGVHKWIFPANWKFAAENFLGDTYHNPSHRSVDMIGIGPCERRGIKGRRDNEYNNGRHVWVGFPAGHGMHSVLMPPDTEYSVATSNTRSWTNTFATASTSGSAGSAKRRGCCRSPARSSPTPRITGASRAALCVWHPHSATETEAWRFFLVDADAPAEVKDVLRRFYMRYSGPAGMTEQDDMENWLYATAASKGTDRAALSVQLPEVDGRVQDRRSGARRCRHADHRADAAQLLPRLCRLPERRRLGRAARP